ncbi:MAG: hypothetical protein MUE50_18665 [Pirellulaceae bacterium]|jgi:hypothetical protein|nr:hypothetical protein [Pirellulaceae bacterium]MCU0980640.1 hypothetical protein [Pirellulaceae bacterium]
MLKSTTEKLWGDESGFIVSADLLLISSILVIGLLVGLVSLRDQIVQELGDVAVAVGNLNQSYSFAGQTVAFGTFVFTVAGSNFTDESDFCEDGVVEDNTSVGISVSEGASSEE